MKPIDESTLEAIAELICGSYGGGERGYSTPGHYRTMGEINDFFRRSGVVPAGESGTRKWFVLESLQIINGTKDVDKVLSRLVSPKEYPGNSTARKQVQDHLNGLLQVEGFEVSLSGVDPVLRELPPTVPTSEPTDMSPQVTPDFHRLLQDVTLAEILEHRWHEATKCTQAGAYLAAVVMMGSVLEGVLLNRLERNPEMGYRAKGSPKDGRTGKPKPIKDWGLSRMIDVAHEIGWLHGNVKQFSHVLRESRNLVHPYVQRRIGDSPDRDTCLICWQVVQAAVSSLLH